MKALRKIVGFEWDEYNHDKIFKKHRVTDVECEEIFFDDQKKILDDILHSGAEKRYIVIGQTKEGRALFVAYTIRRHTIRVISARDLNKKERHFYEEKGSYPKIQKRRP